MPEQQNFHFVSKLIHWITALIFLGLLFVGFFMTEMEFSEDKLALYALHKSFGLLILILLVIRIISRFIITKPKPLSTHNTLEKFLAHAAHVFLYIALLMLPLSGWIMSSAGDFTVQFFGLNVPDIANKNEELFKSSRLVHATFALAVVAVLCAHIAGALKHHFIDKDTTLQRMTSLQMGVKSGALLTAAIALIFLSIGYAYAPKLLKAKPAPLQLQNAEKHIEEQTVHTSDVTKWDILTEQSELSFTATQYGQEFSGTFDFYGQIFFDPNNLTESKAFITIDIASIKTGSEDRDSQAKSDEWFDSLAFPTAHFTSEKFTKTPEGYIAHGTLKIRETEQNIDLPFQLNFTKKDNEEHVHMTGQIEVLRLDYNIGQGQWSSTDAIGNSVKIVVNLMARSETK